MSKDSSSIVPISSNSNNQSNMNGITSKCNNCKNLTVKVETQKVIIYNLTKSCSLVKFNFLEFLFFEFSFFVKP